MVCECSFQVASRNVTCCNGNDIELTEGALLPAACDRIALSRLPSCLRVGLAGQQASRAGGDACGSCGFGLAYSGGCRIDIYAAQGSRKATMCTPTRKVRELMDGVGWQAASANPANCLKGLENAGAPRQVKRNDQLQNGNQLSEP